LSDLCDPGAYIRTAIIRLASNHRRTLSRRRTAFRLVDPGVLQVVDVYPSDLADLGALDPRDRAVVYLSVIEHASADEVAGALGWSAGRVRMRKHRALRRLRMELEDFDA